MPEEEDTQVQVRFITQQRQYAITESAIFVPARLRRYGLSEIVNHLLGAEKPVPFDFLIDGQFLRTSLTEYLENAGLSTENLITIEYVESMLPPMLASAFQHDDWISSVKGLSQQGFFLTGSYDKCARIWNTSGKCISTFRGHTASIKSVAWLEVDESQATFLSTSQDQSVLAWQYSFLSDNQAILYECEGHKASVESVATDSSKQHFATASWDSTIKIWTSALLDENETTHVEDSRHKRRKTHKPDDRKSKSAVLTLEGHVGPTSSVVFDSASANTLYSGGWDHSVRMWDVEQGVNVSTKNCEKVVYGIDHSPHSRLLASGHADRIVRLWDPRADDANVVKLTLVSHILWVPTVSWSPTSAYMLVSGSHDGTCKVWDIRSKAPLYTIAAPEVKGSKDHRKLFAVNWEGERILSGGEDCQLRIHSAKM